MVWLLGRIGLLVMLSSRLLAAAAGLDAETPLGAPTQLLGTLTSTPTIELSWADNSTGETGFSIERCTDGVNYAEYDTVGAGVTSYSDSTVSAGTTYYYRVRATGSVYSAYSNTVSLSPATLLTSLVGHWRLDEASGTRYDAHGSNDLTQHNGPVPWEGVTGTANFFNGTAQYLHAADATELRSGGSDFTWSVWVKLQDRNSNRTIISKWNYDIGDGSEYLLVYRSSEDRFRFLMRDAANANNAYVESDNHGSPPLYTWLLVTFWYDSTNEEIGIQVNDGTPDTVAHTTGVNEGTGDLLFAAQNSTSSPAAFWNSTMEDASFWHRVLTSDERAALYNDGAGLPYPFMEQWNKYASNPVVEYGAYAWDNFQLRSPDIAEYDENTWVMFFVAQSTTKFEGISYATAPKSDPHNWTRHTSLILASGTTGAWDEEIAGVSGFKDTDGDWKILYCSNEGAIGLATGSSLASLTKYASNPVFEGTGSDWEEYVRHPSVIKVGSTYHMFYDGRKSQPRGWDGDIGHATSTDLINWTRDLNNPVIERSASAWEEDDITAPFAIDINGTYYIFYAGYSHDLQSGDKWPHFISYVTTTDFVTFTKSPHACIITPGDGGWDDWNVAEPTVMFEADGTLHLYYDGTNSSNEGNIGYATRELP